MVIACIIIAIVIRFYRTSSNNFYLLAGSDGPYFALQVKYLIEHHKLAFSDMPLLFVWGAILAKILYFFHAGSLTHCILLSIKLTDAFLPPLAAIPVLLIAKELNNHRQKLNTAIKVLAAFAILSYTPLVHFSYQLQKNGVAVMLVFLYFYYLVKIVKYNQRVHFLKALVVFVVCSLTHFGSCGLLLFCSLIILLAWLINIARSHGSYPVKKILLVAISLLTILALIAIFDTDRFARILHAPVKLFEAPAILFSLNGHNLVFFQPLITILILTILLAIQGILLIIRNRTRMEKYKLLIGLSFAFCTIFLANPFLGLEWAKRLFMMAYIPLTILYMVVFSFLNTRWIKVVSVVAFGLLTAISFAYALLQKPFISLSDQAFEEFEQLNSKVNLSSNDAVVSRQDLRLLANWTFETKGISDYLLTKEAFKKLNSVYFIQQVKDNNSAFREIPKVIPPNYNKLFEGQYFKVYKISSDEYLPVNPEKIFKGIRGVIIRSFSNRLLVKDHSSGFIRTVYFKENATEFPVGMKVEVNGEFTPFSLAIQADTIKKLNSFE